MNYGISELKEATQRLEAAIRRVDAEAVETNAKLIQSIAAEIKTMFFNTHVNESEIQIKTTSRSSENFSTINSIQFMYKPMYFANVYESNDIEYYVKERTEELIESASIDAHNDFWQSHEIVYGNVYGSMPYELLDDRGVEKLKRCGWRKVMVDVLEVKQVKSDFEVRKLAENHFRHYIIIKEKETKSLLILRYNF